MKKKTKIILLLAISIISLSIGLYKKYFEVYGTIGGTNNAGQYVEKEHHLDDWIKVLQDMEKLQRIHSSAFGDNFDSGLKEMQRINYLCYFLFFVSVVALIILFITLADKHIDKNHEMNLN